MKSGIKTTEFWITILGSILVAGADELGIPLSETTVTAIVTMIVAYTFGRIFSKKAEAKKQNQEEKKDV